MITLTNAVELSESSYQHLNITADSQNSMVWCEMINQPRACFTQELLDELVLSQNWFIGQQDYEFYVLSSASKSVFSYGGDLALFHKLIKNQAREELYDYMKQCIATLSGISRLASCEGIALVQGTAFGGGFEAALACDTIIAEKSATFGFPERLFNSIPGIGPAYQYLLRRIEPIKAQKLIKSARTYTADELYQMGIIDKVVPDGTGRDAVLEHISQYKKYKNSYDSLKTIFKSGNELTYDDMLRLGENWVETVLRLSDRDLEILERLAGSQERQTSKSEI